jgi:hypothetical protein
MFFKGVAKENGEVVAPLSLVLVVLLGFDRRGAGRRSSLGPRWGICGSPTFWSTSVGPRRKLGNGGSRKHFGRTWIPVQTGTVSTGPRTKKVWISVCSTQPAASHHSPRVRQLSDSRCSAAPRGSTAPGLHGHQTTPRRKTCRTRVRCNISRPSQLITGLPPIVSSNLDIVALAGSLKK